MASKKKNREDIENVPTPTVAALSEYLGNLDDTGDTAIDAYVGAVPDERRDEARATLAFHSRFFRLLVESREVSSLDSFDTSDGQSVR